MKKRCVEDVAAQVMDTPDMEGLRVRDVIDKNGTGANALVLHFGELPPGKEHVLHRHPHSEEAIYVLQGAGVCFGEEDPVQIGEGDAVYIERGEWHGVRNDRDETLKLLVVLGGVGSYESAGYELKDNASATGPER